MGNGSFNVAPICCIYSLEAFKDCGGFRTEPVTADNYLVFDIVATRPVVLITSGLHWYRVHSDQVQFHNGGFSKHMAEPVRYYPKIIDSPKCPLSIEERKIAYANLVGNFRVVRKRII